MATIVPKRIRAAAIIVHGDKILLIQRLKDGREYFAFPGGGVEADEVAETAVLREVREETSVTVEVEKLLYHHIYDDRTEQLFYLCRYLTGEPRLDKQSNEARAMQEDSSNFYRPYWYPLANLQRLLLYPLEIRDWLVADLRNNFADTPHAASLKIADLRHDR